MAFKFKNIFARFCDFSLSFVPALLTPVAFYSFSKKSLNSSKTFCIPVL